MKKFGYIVAIVLVAIVAWSARGYFTDSDIRTVSDTVYVDKPYRIETIKEADKVVPPEVTMWKTDYDTIEKIELVKDTVKVYADTLIKYNSRFLTQYPNAPKFLGLEVGDKIEFTALSPSGRTVTRSWDYRPRFKMSYSGQGNVDLTYKKQTLGFSHSVGAGYFMSLKSSGPYLTYSPRVTIFGIRTGATVYAKQNPMVTIGVEYGL